MNGVIDWRLRLYLDDGEVMSLCLIQHDRHEEPLRASENRYYQIFSNGEQVGSFILKVVDSRFPNNFVIYNLSVDNNHRGRKYGREGLEKIRSVLSGGIVWLWCVPQLCSYYEAIGFVSTRRKTIPGCGYSFYGTENVIMRWKP